MEPIALVQKVLGFWRESWKKRQRLPMWEWARKWITLDTSYAVPGPFNIERSLYLKKPMEALQDPEVQEVTIMKAVQTAASLLSEIFVAWIIANAPGPTMWNFKSDEDAKEQAETRINNLFDNCEPVRNKYPENRHKKKLTQIFFRNMWLLIQGSGLANLQSKGVKYLINDELWMWKPGHLGEAYGRTTAFSKNGCKILNVSQGGVVNDDLDEAFKRGTMEVWGFRCPECQTLQEYKMKQLKYDTNETTCPKGEWNYLEVAKTVRYQCENCERKFFDTPMERRQMNDSGDYIVTNPNAAKNVRSFRWNALASDLIRWDFLVDKWIRSQVSRSKGVFIPFTEFIQKRCAESWDEKAHQIVVVDKIVKQEYAFEESVERWGAFRFMTIDVQHKHLWVIIRDWKRDGSSRLTWAGMPETWGEAVHLQEKYGVKSHDVFVDSANDTRRVYRKVLDNSWVALTGGVKDMYYHRVKKKTISRIYSEKVRIDTGIGLPEQGNPRGFVFLYHWAPYPTNEILERLKSGEGATWIVSAKVIKCYDEHLSAVVKKEEIDEKTGKKKFYYGKIRDDDHLRDCELMQVVAASMERCLGEPSDEGDGK